MTAPNWTPVLGDIGAPGSTPALALETAARVAEDLILAAAIAAIPPFVDAYTKTQSDARYQTPQTTLAGYTISDAYTKTQADARYAQIGDSYTKAASDARYQTPQTTIAGYGITDFNSLGDARWAKLVGGSFTGFTQVYDGTNNQATIEFQVGTSSVAKNAAKFWGKVFFGQNNDQILDSSGLGFVQLGSSGGASLGTAAGTVYLKALAGGVTLTVPLIVTSGAAPALATSTGVVGQWAWDSGFIYICISANTWKRVAVATF